MLGYIKIMSQRKIVLIIHNVRSSHNVGSILRTADGLGVWRVYLTGYTPYPATKDDPRLPHIAAKATRAIQKTALGAEKSTNWKHQDDIFPLLEELRVDGYTVVALEQTPSAKPLHEFMPAEKIALIVGSEIGGIDPEVLRLADEHVKIPMLGKKDSLNVAIAAAMAAYHLRFVA